MYIASGQYKRNSMVQKLSSPPYPMTQPCLRTSTNEVIWDSNLSLHNRQLACESTDANFSTRGLIMSLIVRKGPALNRPHVVLISSIIRLTLVTRISPFKCQQSSKEPNNYSALSHYDLTNPAKNNNTINLNHIDLLLVIAVLPVSGLFKTQLALICDTSLNELLCCDLLRKDVLLLFPKQFGMASKNSCFIYWLSN